MNTDSAKPKATRFLLKAGLLSLEKFLPPCFLRVGGIQDFVPKRPLRVFAVLPFDQPAKGDAGVKTNDSFSLSPRSRALHHVSIMNNTQHRPDAEIDNADRYQKFAAFCDSKQKKPRSNNQEG